VPKQSTKEHHRYKDVLIQHADISWVKIARDFNSIPLDDITLHLSCLLWLGNMYAI